MKAIRNIDKYIGNKNNKNKTEHFAISDFTIINGELSAYTGGAYVIIPNIVTYISMSFQNNTSTRILEKDSFKREYDCVPENNQFYTVPSDVYNVQYKGQNSAGTTICKSDCRKM